MKALILAAGFGTRLAPYTHTLPKPLFTVNNKPVLDLAIQNLLDAGCDEIYINTHHLADQVRAFILGHPRRALLTPVHEPEILDTGGAIANLREMLSENDFFVVNADIVSDADLNTLIRCHKTDRALATLLVHDCPRFNKLEIKEENPHTGRVIRFDAPSEKGLAFTGIQVLSPEIFNHMPPERVFSSIDIYKSLCASGRIRAVRADSLYWQDMGTPEDYAKTSRQWLAGKIFNLPLSRFKEMRVTPLAGDGSDRCWFRTVLDKRSIVISDHGICLQDNTKNPVGTQPGNLAQLTAFTAIGDHLKARGLCAPKILGHDKISGQVALEDLGNTHLADRVRELGPDKALPLYQEVIEALIQFSQQGIQGFDPAWTCQTREYSKKMILDLECRYFIEAFVKGFLGKTADWNALEPAFSHIADHALAKGYSGLMHRDFQSRNIMISKDRVWFIDFQSARKGPLQYDLASLLIDPYVKLPQRIQETLLAFAMDRLTLESDVQRQNFCQSYKYCCITRNLQMLGAFGFLTRVKNKSGFEAYIPHALAGLKLRLNKIKNHLPAPLAGFVTDL